MQNFKFDPLPESESDPVLKELLECLKEDNGPIPLEKACRLLLAVGMRNYQAVMATRNLLRGMQVWLFVLTFVVLFVSGIVASHVAVPILP